MIVNTSSVFGLVGIPFQSAYCASKFAVRGFTDSLRHELRGTGVRAVTVHPGGVKTNIARNARYHAHPTRPDLSHEEAAKQFDAMALTTPERAAKIIHDGRQGRPQPDPGRARRLRVRCAGPPGADALLRRPGAGWTGWRRAAPDTRRALAGRQETVSVPTMPPARWPGTLQ